MPANKKYNVFPGWVKAKDGDSHFISAPRLMELYCVSLKECHIITSELDFRFMDRSLTSLHPKDDGDYSIASTS